LWRRRGRTQRGGGNLTRSGQALHDLLLQLHQKPMFLPGFQVEIATTAMLAVQEGEHRIPHGLAFGLIPKTGEFIELAGDIHLHPQDHLAIPLLPFSLSPLRNALRGCVTHR
jgi:hypothetical protein